jgi:hypothetical protein
VPALLADAASLIGHSGSSAFRLGFEDEVEQSIGRLAVQWNRAKLVYDGILLAGVVLYIGAGAV